MRPRIITLFAGLFLLPGAAAAQAASAPAPADSTALAVALFRTAIDLAQRTAHGAAASEVVCLSRRRRSRLAGDGTPGSAAPDSAVVARLQAEMREELPIVRPVNACRVDPLGSAPRSVSLVVERATGRRGLLVWATAPTADGPGRLSVEVGYYQHGLSAADWRCAVRREGEGWLVDGCRLERIS
jgi:hypothetical protein